jgi:hypothetical protein
MASAARAIRTPVNNRFDNEAIRSFVAKHRRRSRSAFEAVLLLSLITVLTVAARQPCRPRAIGDGDAP